MAVFHEQMALKEPANSVKEAVCHEAELRPESFRSHIGRANAGR